MPGPHTYIVLGDDGRHVSLSRALPPDPATARDIGDKLQRDGHGGWIACMEGDYWAKSGRLDLTEVEMIAPTSTTFFDASRAFLAHRRAQLGLPPSEPERAAA